MFIISSIMRVPGSTPAAAELADLAYALALSEPARAVAEADKALLQARHERDLEALARAWHARGMAHIVRGQLAEALDTAGEARKDFAERFRIAEPPPPILVLEADILRHKGDLPGSIGRCLEALEQARALGNSRYASRALFSYALATAFLPEPDISLGTFDSLLAEASGRGNPMQVLIFSVYRCYVLNVLGRFEEAHSALQSLEAEVKAKAGSFLHAEVLDNMGVALAGLGRPAEAESWLRESMAMERSLGREAYLAYTRLHLAEACLALGRNAEAEGLARQVALAAESSGDLQLAASSASLRARCLEALSHWREAAESYRECLGHCRRIADARYQASAVLGRAVRPSAP